MQNNRIKKRILLLFLLLFLSFFFSGCRTELWVNNDGSGRGVVSEIPTNIFTKSLLENELKSQGLQSISVTEKEEYFQAKFIWKDFEVLGNREKGKDGSIYLDFGYINELKGISIVHVPGSIIDTTGKQIGRKTVDFTSLNHYKKATISYKPQLCFSKVMLLIMLIIITIGVGHKFLIGKKPVPTGTDEPVLQEIFYCSKCSAEISTDSIFCDKCRHSLK
ncbi:hypothetical protein M0P98_00725 [bacterium]|nr:hypothetical protein [bacterium]